MVLAMLTCFVACDSDDVQGDSTTGVAGVTTESSDGNDSGVHNHIEGEWVVDKAATCTAAGSQKRTCSCGATETQTIPATGHTAGAWTTTTPAGCETDGVKTQSCSGCGATMATDTIPATGHTESAWITETAATTTSTGLKYKKCNVCGKRLAEEVIPVVTTPTGNTSSAVDTTLEHIVDPSQWVVIDGLDREEINNQVNGYDTTENSSVNYYVSGKNDVANVMVVRIPKADLGIEGNDFVIDFKWMDNCNEDEDFMNVYSNGDAAPLGRYNYRYDSQ